MKKKITPIFKFAGVLFFRDRTNRDGIQQPTCNADYARELRPDFVQSNECN